MEKDKHKKDSVEERVQKLLQARKKLFLRATIKAARWLPLWLPAILFSRGTFISTIDIRLKGTYFRGDRLIVWLRRFNISWIQAFNFYRALNVACLGFGIPITIQDASIQFSWYRLLVEIKREPILRWFFVFLLICIGLFCILPEYWVHPLAISIWIIIVGIMISRAYPRALLPLNAETAHNQILDLIRKIQCKEGLYYGVTVIRCDDDFWREVVELALSNADIALVDVTEITENLKWEIEQSIQKLEPEAVILLFAHSKGLGNELPMSIEQEVASMIGKKNFLRCQVFTYPVSYGPLGIFNVVLFQKVKKKFIETIAKAIVTSEKNHR